jgi:hypothetical protein
MAQFVASGGDWGDPVTEQMAVLAPSDVLGIHLNMPSAVPAEIAKALESGGPPPAGLSADERQAYDQLDFCFKYGLGYANERSVDACAMDQCRSRWRRAAARPSPAPEHTAGYDRRADFPRTSGYDRAARE